MDHKSQKNVVNCYCGRAGERACPTARMSSRPAPRRYPVSGYTFSAARHRGGTYGVSGAYFLYTAGSQHHCRSCHLFLHLESLSGLSFSCCEVNCVALTPKQRRFVQEYLVDLNATAAALRAGYKGKTAGQQGHNLLQMPKVQAEIQKAKAEREERTQVTSDMVVRELAKIAFANGSIYSKVVKTGKGYMLIATPTEDLTEDQRAAIACIEETKFGIKVSMCDKVRALELLGIDAELLSMEEYDELYETLTDPDMPSHLVKMPYAQGYLTFRAYITQVDDELAMMGEDFRLWKNASIQFTAMKPQREAS